MKHVALSTVSAYLVCEGRQERKEEGRVVWKLSGWEKFRKTVGCAAQEVRGMIGMECHPHQGDIWEQGPEEHHVQPVVTFECSFQAPLTSSPSLRFSGASMARPLCLPPLRCSSLLPPALTLWLFLPRKPHWAWGGIQAAVGTKLGIITVSGDLEPGLRAWSPSPAARVYFLTVSLTRGVTSGKCASLYSSRKWGY